MRAAFAPLQAAIPLACWAALLFLPACADAPPRTPVGVSDAPAEAPAPPKVEAAPPRWPDFVAAQAWPEAAPAVTALGHRRDGTLIHVRVESAALGAYRALATDAPMPEGARVAAFHETASGQLLGGYVLEKRAGVWIATELDARGGNLPNDGAACLRCHDLAPTDHLFGVMARASGRTPAPAGEFNDPALR